MSAIKDLIDFSTQLSKSVTDKKILNVVVPLQQKALAAERENAAIEAKAFEANRHHAEEMATLKKEHADAISALKSHYETIIADLKTEHADAKAKWKQEKDDLNAKLATLQEPDSLLTLDATKTSILVFLGDGHNHLSWEVSEHLKISEQRALFHLNELDSMTPQLIHCQANARPDIPTTYSISHHGRGYLVKQGLPI